MKDLSKLKQDICKGNAGVTLDYANPEHAAYFLERFGGEEFLKTKFPAVYKAFIRTRELHKAATIQPASDAMKGEAFYMTAIGVELEPQHTVLNGQKEQATNKDALFSNACLHLKEASPRVIMLGEMQDITDSGKPKNLDTFAFVSDDQPIAESNNVLEYPFQDILGFNEHNLKSGSECHYVKSDGTLASEMRESTTFLVKGMKQIVKNFEITAPKSNTGNNPLIFLYNRNPFSGEVSDYYYNADKINLHDNQLNTLVPIEGSFTVADGFTPVKFSTSRSVLPTLLYEGDGVVEYGHSITDLANCFQIDPANKNKVNFKLSEDWGARLDVSHYDAHAVTLKLQFSFFFDIYDSATKTTWSMPFSITSLISPPPSGYYKAIGPSVSIPEIKIRWGCFHKDTLITMADGSKKAIHKVREGDMVATAAGKSLRVRGIVKGHEAKLIHIEAQNGLALEVSATHPVAVERGSIPARLLNAADILVLADKTASPIKYIYECVYKDDVYNLDTGVSRTMLIANGLLAGDLIAQNEYEERKPAPVFSEETLEVAEQMQQLFEQLFSKGA